MWVVDFRYIDTKISALFASMTLVYKAARRIHVRMHRAASSTSLAFAMLQVQRGSRVEHADARNLLHYVLPE